MKLGDTLLLKLAEATYNPKTLLYQKGLEYLEEALPENFVETARNLPNQLLESARNLPNQLLKNEDELEESLSQLAQKAKTIKKDLSVKKDSGPSNFFMDEDQDISLGPVYHVPVSDTP